MNLVHERDVDLHEETLTDLLKDLRDEAFILIRQQIELAKQETTEKVTRLGTNAAYLLAGGAVLYAGLLFALAGITILGYWWFTAMGVSPVVAAWIWPLITGIIVGAVGYFLVTKAINTFRHTSVVPEKTVHSIKEDRVWLTRKER